MNQKLKEIQEEINLMIDNSNLDNIIKEDRKLFVKEEFEKINHIFDKYENYYYGLARVPIETLKEDIIKKEINKTYLSKELNYLNKLLDSNYKETLPETQIEREKIRKEREESFKKNEEYELNFMKEYYPEYLEGGYFQSNEFNEIFDKVSEYAKEQVAIHFADGHISYPMNPRRYYDIIISKLKSDYGIDWKDKDTIWYEMHPNGYIFY